MKKCTRCNKSKDLIEFTISNKEYVNCNECRLKMFNQAEVRKCRK